MWSNFYANLPDFCRKLPALEAYYQCSPLYQHCARQSLLYLVAQLHNLVDPIKKQKS
jgi:hypothetical protein